jgi:hypothetical protein
MIISANFGSTFLSGSLTDMNYRRVARAHGIAVDRKRGESLPKEFPLLMTRLQVTFPSLCVGNLAILAFGWVVQAETHLAVPLVLLFIIGLLFVGSFQILSGVVLIDLYPQSPSTITAANNLCRCLVGAGGTAVIVQMLDAMGRGWCFTFISLVVFSLFPIPWILTKWGPGWQEERRKRLESKGKS